MRSTHLCLKSRYSEGFHVFWRFARELEVRRHRRYAIKNALRATFSRWSSCSKKRRIVVPYIKQYSSHSDQELPLTCLFNIRNCDEKCGRRFKSLTTILVLMSDVRQLAQTTKHIRQPFN